MPTRRPVVRLAAAICAGILVTTAPSPGADPEPLAEASGFGVEDSWAVTIPAAAFRPIHRETWFVYAEDGGYVYAVSDYATTCSLTLLAPIDASLVPNGALITHVRAYVWDSMGGTDENLQVDLCRNWLDADDGDGPAGDCPYSLHTTGNPGQTAISDDSDHQVEYRHDVDDDGTVESVGYNLAVRFGSDSEKSCVPGVGLVFHQVRLLVRRQMSPAPASATFADVDSEHPQFAFIEALKEAGISEGCGGGNFCPDHPVTRAQLAMFLARALGLHWPAF